MEWLQNNAEWVAALFGAALGAWTMAQRLHKSAIQHLAIHFATKKDLEHGLSRIEVKLDTALALRFRRLEAHEDSHAAEARNE